MRNSECEFCPAGISQFQIRNSQLGAKRMICPSCGHDNIEGADRCEDCVTSLLNLDVPQAEREGPASSVMDDDISRLEQEFLSVSPDTTALEVIRKMKEA